MDLTAQNQPEPPQINQSAPIQTPQPSKPKNNKLSIIALIFAALAIITFLIPAVSLTIIILLGLTGLVLSVIGERSSSRFLGILAIIINSLIILSFAGLFTVEIYEDLSNKTEQASNSSTTYVSKKYNFEIVPPQNWDVDETGNLGTLVIFREPNTEENLKSGFMANINIMSEATQDLDLETYVKSNKDIMPQGLTNYKSVGERKAEEANGYLLGTTFTQGSYNIRNLQLYTISNGQAYVVTATALESDWDKYKDLFEKSLLTFKIKK